MQLQEQRAHDPDVPREIPRDPPVLMRREFLRQAGLTLLGTTMEQDGNAVDLLACASQEKLPCFVVASWDGDRLYMAELFLTEAEARACFKHGKIYHLEDFALPPMLLRQLAGA